jgi:thiol-disulfide isomerase/thioredoxin
MMKGRAFLAVLLVTLALPALLLHGCGGTADESDALVTVPAMPDITFADREDLERIMADTRGKVAVVNLWATWCVPCVAELPYFAEFYEKRDPNQVVFVSLSLDEVEKIETDLRRFQAQHELPFDFYVLDEAINVDEMSAALNATVTGALPATIVYDSEGVVRQLWEEPITLQQLEEAVAAAVAASPMSTAASAT